jgi:hypothetical protein
VDEDFLFEAGTGTFDEENASASKELDAKKGELPFSATTTSAAKYSPMKVVVRSRIELYKTHTTPLKPLYYTHPKPIRHE